MTKNFSLSNKSGNFLLGTRKLIIAGVGIGLALSYQSASTAQTCNPFGCPNPGAAECNPFGCPPSPAYWEEGRQNLDENRRRDRDEYRHREWDENRRRDRDEYRYRDRDENRRRDRDEYRYRDRDENRRRDRDEIYDEIDEIYQEVLGRDADRRGFRIYRQRLESGWSLQEVRRDIANSEEAEEAINSIYQQQLDRDADRRGLKFYKQRLESGWSLNQVRRHIATSEEARDRRR